MKIKYLRWLDKYLGFLFIIPLSIFKIFSRKSRLTDTRKINKILIIKFWGFGSIVLAYDFFQAIRQKHPDAYLCVLTLKQNSQIFELAGLFDRIIGIDIKNIFSFGCNIIKVILELRKQSFDVSFDFEFTSRFSAIVSCLINAKRSVGFDYDGVWRGKFFSDVLHFQEDKKLRVSYLEMSRLIGGDSDFAFAPLQLQIENEQKVIVDNLLKEESLDELESFIGININASELSLLRRWPKEYFVILAEELINLYSLHIIFLGSKDDLEYVDSAIGLIHQKKKAYVHDFSGRLSLTQMAYLMGKFKLFISNDSGPLHLAAYLKIPTVSFFGPETPLIYGPEGDKDIVFYKNLSCSPCMRVRNYKHAKCQNHQYCLVEIKPSEVLNEIKRKNIF
ncbi:MAG: glycosyltransferase family 9 protein [Candidatus Omnitrophica bacterium]|nr:glycosyltransferase family 9 protein [Candidatus Omnitrophota bacterium]